MAYKLYDLSQPFGDGTPMWPRWLAPDIRVAQGAFAGITPAGHPEWPLLRGGGGYVGHLHAATHIDAPIYCIPEGITADKIPLENFYGTGVIIDMRHKGKWDIITADDLENAKPKIEEGDFVVVNTGWHKYFRKENYVFFNHFPGFYESAGKWFVQKRVKAVAIDGGAMDSPLAHRPLDKVAPWLYEEYKEETGKDANKEFPIYEPCHLALAKAGIPGIEVCGGQIEEVTGIRCTLACFPIRYVTGEASIVRLVAIVEK